MAFSNPWLISSLLLFAVWILIWLCKPGARKELFWVSFFTLFLGFTEPLFVPEYWNPPSLFNLAQRIGFDIESFIFCFAIGGIGAVIYELFFPVTHERVRKKKQQPRSPLLWVAVSSPILFFPPLHFLTNLNPIYSASIAVFFGSLAILAFRKDLWRKSIGGGVIFLSLYFVFFFVFTKMYPTIVSQVWNLSALSGILILGVPVEELFFALSFGMFWSSVYECAERYKIKRQV